MQTDEIEIDGKRFKKSIDFSEIVEKIKSVAKNINKDYTGMEPIFLITMKGAIFFATELMKYVSIPHKVEIVSAKSYGDSMENRGEVMVLFNAMDFTDKDIIIVEDIVDSGKTIIKLKKDLLTFRPRSISVATLIIKPHRYIEPIDVDYSCFNIDNDAFIIGFGLDYKEYGRNLNGLYFNI